MSKISDKHYLDFIYGIYEGNKDLVDFPFVSLLRRAGYLKTHESSALQTKQATKKFNSATEAELYVYSCTEVNNSDSLLTGLNRGLYVEIINPVEVFPSKSKRKQKILTSQWRPKDRIQHEDDFYDWINSIIAGFKEKIYYKKYDLYCTQAEQWLEENDSLANYTDIDDAREYMFREFDRCFDNTMYFALKYCYLQEGSAEGGRRKYTIGNRYEHHKIILFLLDSGYNFMLGKPRQIGSTSVIGIFAIKEALLNSNHYSKLVTEDEKTGKEIFEDKIKFVYSNLPDWMKTKVGNFRGTLFKLGKAEVKGDIAEVNSRIEVLAPQRTVINGGSPQRVYLDEIGSIGILSEIIKEGRPTLFWVNPKTDKLEIKRNVIAWGTGTYSTKGKGAYEKEWNTIYGMWQNKTFVSAMIPVFFDWRVRLTDEEYKREKEYYYGGGYGKSENVDLETAKIQFHQHYPTTPSDMFRSTAKTLVPLSIIEGGYERIREAADKDKCEYGYFLPKYDYNHKIADSGHNNEEYKVIGVEWVKCERDDKFVSTTIFRHPSATHTRRYYQGTDPISAETGHSKMASTIYDDLHGLPAALLNHRQQGDHKASYTQCMLLGMYYSVVDDVPELLERNIGQNYVDFLEKHGMNNRLVYNSQLPDIFMSGNNSLIGIDNKGKRSQYIIANMNEVVRETHEKIYIIAYFEQLKTFVHKITSSGNGTWETLDKKIYYDDALFSLVFSYICKKCFPYHYPVGGNDVDKTNKTVEYEYGYDKDMNSILVPKIKKIVNGR